MIEVQTDYLVEKNDTLAVLPLRGTVVFPKTDEDIHVGRDLSIAAVHHGIRNNGFVVIVSQIDHEIQSPTHADLFTIGTLAQITKIQSLPDDTMQVHLTGIRRVHLTMVCEGSPIMAKVENLTVEQINLAKFGKLMDVFEEQCKESAQIARQDISDLFVSLEEYKNQPSAYVDTAVKFLNIPVKQKQQLLEQLNPHKRLESLISMLSTHLDLVKLERKIQKRARGQIDKNQKEYYLSEQMKAIQKEMESLDTSDIENFEEKAKKLGIHAKGKEKLLREIKRLKQMSSMSPEAGVIRSYIEWLLDVPWKKRSKLHSDIQRAATVLNDDHYGLDDIKQRILEHLSAYKRSDKVRTPVLCLVGPPGVGKTSLGASIAKATNRTLIRMSLGGMRDEAEIRGHRRTYIGAMPGKIVQNLVKAKVKNPLFLLDEIDKLGADFRGDPASALLEVLDPEQNHAFIDHYLEVECDLSEIMFICTSNSLRIPDALRDRLEIIELSGYTEYEKHNIATKHLLPKILKQYKLTNTISVTDAAIQTVISRYVREAGVRKLERQLEKIARKHIFWLETQQIKECKKVITPALLKKYLGVERYQHLDAEKTDQVGQATGLAWTQAGGELLNIETSIVPGKGQLQLTGSMGDVMRESAKAAITVLRGKSNLLGLADDFFSKNDIHIHIPEGATPKDGPSAGVAMCMVLLSVFTQQPVRHDVAMTGEVTIRGKVLAIGGLKEKLLAAHRGGIRKVIIPKENTRDLDEIPNNILQGLKILPVAGIDEAFSLGINGFIDSWRGTGMQYAQLYSHEKFDGSQVTSMN